MKRGTSRASAYAMSSTPRGPGPQTPGLTTDFHTGLVRALYSEAVFAMACFRWASRILLYLSVQQYRGGSPKALSPLGYFLPCRTQRRITDRRTDGLSRFVRISCRVGETSPPHDAHDTRYCVVHVRWNMCTVVSCMGWHGSADSEIEEGVGGNVGYANRCLTIGRARADITETRWTSPEATVMVIYSGNLSSASRKLVWFRTEEAFVLNPYVTRLHAPDEEVDYRRLDLV